MTAFISKATSGDGVVAYQDHSDLSQFWYVPLRVDTTLGGSLTAFKVDYWGIGARYLVQESTTGKIRSMFGAVLSGTAVFDISDYQRKKITRKIEQEFGVKNPKLAPLRLKKAVMQPVWAERTLALGRGADVKVPTEFQFGSQFNYLFGTGNSLFANFVANQGADGSVKVNPAFGMQVVGQAEFRGEPWKVTVEAELSSVWREIRKKISGSASIGWFNLGTAEFNQIITTLERDAVIKTHFEQGSLDTAQFGSQVFEMGKKIAEKINGIGGGDFFKFEPNPEPSAGIVEMFGLSSIWRVSINASYSERSFSQVFHYKEILQFDGNFEASIPAGMSLAVVCNAGAQQYFNELGQAEPCVTPNKVANLQKRLTAENVAKKQRSDEAWAALIGGKISDETYNKLMKYINETSLTEDGAAFSVEGSELLHDVEYFKGVITQACIKFGVDDYDFESQIFSINSSS